MRLSRPSPVRWPLVVMLAAPGSAAAHPLARLAPAPARTTGEGPDADSDEVTTRGMPGADSATRGDASAGVASGAAADAAKEVFRRGRSAASSTRTTATTATCPDNHVNRLRSAVPRTGEFSLNLAVAYIRRDAMPGRFSPTFELALQAGPAADALMYYEPTPGGDASRFAGMEVFKHIGRANVGFKTRRGTELSVGMHLSPVGIGIHWTPFNWNYTVSWELDGVPYYLTGLKLVHTINERHGLQLWVVNGWQTLADTNKAPSVMVGYTFTPSPRFNFATFAYAGRSRPTRLAAWRLYSDTQFTYNVDRFGVGGLFDIGSERLTDQPGGRRRCGRPPPCSRAGGCSGSSAPGTWRRAPRCTGTATGGSTGWRTTAARRDVHQRGAPDGEPAAAPRVPLRSFERCRRVYFYRGPAIHDADPKFARDQHAVYLRDRRGVRPPLRRRAQVTAQRPRSQTKRVSWPSSMRRVCDSHEPAMSGFQTLIG
jgi:hypothetical protein